MVNNLEYVQNPILLLKLKDVQLKNNDLIHKKNLSINLIFKAYYHNYLLEKFEPIIEENNFSLEIQKN